MKKFLLMLLILFICGIVSGDLCVEELESSQVLLDLEIYRSYANAKLDFRDVFWNVLYERGKLFFFMILLCFTPIKEKMIFVFICIFSFVWGFFFFSCLTELGMAGVVVGITAVLPQGLFYSGAIGLLLQGKTNYSYHQRDRMVRGTVNYILMVLLFITGCIVESLMGTHFIPWVIRLGLI